MVKLDAMVSIPPGNITEFPYESKTRLIAATLNYAIELVEKLSAKDADRIIAISEGLVESYGTETKFTKNTVRKYFAYPDTLPFIGLLHDKIIGFIIGVPLEHFSDEPWARVDTCLGEHNTVYTYAFVMDRKYRSSGYGKSLKRVYLNWLRKRGFSYVSGHVQEGVAQRWSRSTMVLERFPDWHNTGKVFEYYRRPLA
ncbi:MAG: GNAT family N-acetyltransferase [Lentisphaeria bacterium]|nr:GNAT family N-acetyltransferase [Candidatus Neomarinimicrobiota bacterium]MCF7841502.1 GNAT family N-acetyltransferase [Lentisphaeria bacterium]